MKAKKELLDKYVEENKLRVGKHPTKDLFIYNYTKHTEFNGLWDDITRTARGLVVDSSGEVHALPFPKFFNLEQTDPETIKGLKNVEFEVFEKMDGFLGIGFMYEDEFIISSRGSFESRPCEKANEIWRKKYAPYIKPVKGFTYIFEIIYKEDKIVVDYDFEDLILLGIRANTGEEVAYENYRYSFTGLQVASAMMPIVKRYTGFEDFTSIREAFPERNDGTYEGFVVRFKEPYDGFRIKLKYSEYFRLSKVLTGVSTKSIWEFLKDGKDFTEMLELVPDEFYNWVKDEREKLENKFVLKSETAVEIFRKVYRDGISKKELIARMDAVELNKFDRALCFAQYDDKWSRFDEMIWDSIKPEYQKAFLNPLENANKD